MELTKTQIKDFYQVAEEELEHTLYDTHNEYHEDHEFEYKNYTLTISGVCNSFTKDNHEIDGSLEEVIQSIEVDTLEVWDAEKDESISL